MNREAAITPLKDERIAIAEALREQQVQTHFANLPTAVGGAVFTALLFIFVERNAIPLNALLAWGALLAVVLVGRVTTSLLYQRAALGPFSQRRWLLVYRVGILAHGIVWGLCSALPIASGDELHQAVRIILLAGVAASSFTMTAFDLTAAVFFGAPVLGLLSLQLFAQPEPVYRTLGGAVIGALVFLTLTARRSHTVVRQYVALRLAEVTQAEALRSSEELLERTGATAGVGGWELDLATMSLRLTGQAYRIHGASPAARPTFEAFVRMYGPVQQAQIRAGLVAAAEHGTPCDLVLPFVTTDGQQRWVRLIGEVQLEHGKPVRVSGVVQDLTVAKTTELALAEKNHLMTLLVQTTREGFWFIDSDAVTTDVNPAMCEILGRTRDAIIGKSVFAFVDAANASIFDQQVKRRTDGVAGGYEIALLRPDGSQVDCYNNATPIVDTAGRRVGSIGMFADISEHKRAEKQIRATSEQLARKTRELQLTLDSISQGIVAADGERRFTVYNRRLLELLDLPETLFGPGKTLDDSLAFQTARGDFGAGHGLIDPETRRSVSAFDHKNVPDHYVRRTQSGGYLEVRTRWLPDGGMVRTIADMTAHFEAQQALRESEAQLRALLDAFPGYIAVEDSRFVYTYANERVAKLLGKPREHIVGRSSREVLGAERFAQVQAVLGRAKEGESVTVESEYLAIADQPHAWLQVTHAISSDAATGRRYHYAFGIDISARKAAEHALIAAKDEAERANRAKSEFLSRMSHELRTPMNAIFGFGQLLISDPKNPLADRQREQVGEILRGARHLLSLINEVLDLAVVETGKLQLSMEPVQISELLRECLGLLQPLARGDAIDVKVLDAATCECFVVADRTRLKQVLLNLLSNAIKYNQPGGHVRIVCAPESDAVRIDISDSGPGLSAEQAARLFQAFERLDAVRTGVEGAGLGLALSKHLMGAMGGEIGLTSEVGQGSTFWIRLPRAQAPARAESANPSAPMDLAAQVPPARLRKVLYIEDNPVNVLLMEAMLGRMTGLQLITAPLPTLGLRMAIDERPDLILLDIQLPGMDGFEVLRRLRLCEATRSIPVIAVSANAMASDVDQGMAAGFVQYLTKPLDLHQLLAAVEAAMSAL